MVFTRSWLTCPPWSSLVLSSVPYVTIPEHKMTDRRRFGAQERMSLKFDEAVAPQQQPGASQALPMRMPAAKTSEPPRTTCKVARQKDVSMQRFWIQAIAHSSMKTMTMAIVVAVQKCGMR